MPSVADRERPASLHDALESLQRASETPAKQRAVKVSTITDEVCRHAFEDGLSDDALRAVVHIVTLKTDLDQTSVTTLIKNLYPAQRVPSDVVITVVGALGQGKGKPSLGSQNELVKWLALVHEIIEDANVLSRLYGVLFNMLDMISIRTSLCHLLSLITRRKHVKPFRIQQLLEYSRGLENEPALQGLLRIYKDYYPDIILGTTNMSRTSFPPQPDAEWRAKILAIQERATAAAESTSEQHNGFKVLRKGRKRTKLSLIPDVHTYHTNETSITLEGIDNVKDFVEKLDRIEPPGQLISFLTDPLLQKYVDLKPSPTTLRRIDLWLSTCLEEQYNAVKMGAVDASYLSEILDGLLKHAHYTKTLPHIVQDFLQEFLPLWDGVQHIDSILGLLSYIPMQPFPGAYATFLQPAERGLLSANPSSQTYIHLINLYTSLFRRWAVQAPPGSRPPRPGQVLTHADQRAFSDLVAHVAQISTSLLVSLPAPDIPLTSTILTFYELLSTSSLPDRIPIILPPTHLLQLFAVASSITELSRVAGLIAGFKLALGRHPKPLADYYPEAPIEDFNRLVKDFARLVWTARALVVSHDKDGTASGVGMSCDPALHAILHTYLDSLDPSYAIQISYSVSYHPALASLGAAAWRELEDEEIARNRYDGGSIERLDGPVSKRALEKLEIEGGVGVDWERCRVEVVKWLERRGCGGLREFVWAVVRGVGERYDEEG